MYVSASVLQHSWASCEANGCCGVLTNNDAAMIGRMLTMNFEGMNDWLQTKDLYIVDRGFRDVIVLISWRTGTICKNVRLFEKKKFQTAYYRSRLSTKIWWIVEIIFRRLNQWQFFFSDRVHVVSNQYILHLGEFLRIIIVQGGTMFVTFEGNPFPRINIHMNVYTIIFFSISLNYPDYTYQQNYVLANLENFVYQRRWTPRNITIPRYATSIVLTMIHTAC